MRAFVTYWKTRRSPPSRTGCGSPPVTAVYPIKGTTFISWGRYAEKIGKILDKLTGWIGEKMPPCVELSIQDMVLKNQEAILQNQATIQAGQL